MKRKITHFILIIVLAVLLSQFLPWWSVMISAFITACIVSLKKGAVFFVPFLAIGLLWMVQAFYLSRSNDFILAKKIAILLPLQGNPYLLMVVSAIIGGLAAGIAGVFGKQCNTLFNTK